MNIKLRKCTEKDWDLILSLRNEFFKNSFVQQDRPLTKKEHYAYMNKQSKNPDFHQWMAITGDKIVGYIRILNAEINLMVVKEFQNKGVGSTMLLLLENEAKKLNIHKLIGLVRSENFSSKQIFQKNNYQLKLYRFEKELY